MRICSYQVRKRGSNLFVLLVCSYGPNRWRRIPTYQYEQNEQNEQIVLRMRGVIQKNACEFARARYEVMKLQPGISANQHEQTSKTNKCCSHISRHRGKQRRDGAPCGAAIARISPQQLRCHFRSSARAGSPGRGDVFPGPRLAGRITRPHRDQTNIGPDQPTPRVRQEGV